MLDGIFHTLGQGYFWFGLAVGFFLGNFYVYWGQRKGFIGK
jgi:hypothetical protein